MTQPINQHTHHRSNDIASGIIHAIGLGLAITALVVMVVFAGKSGTAWHVVTAAIFGSGLVLLYGASSLYHLFPNRWRRTKRVFHLLDYSMIYVLIAATYTPLCLTVLQGAWGWSLFWVVWGLAIIGIVLHVTPAKVPTWFAPVLYVLLGWVVLIAGVPLLQAISTQGLVWLVTGGVLYTVGVLFFALHKRFMHWRPFGMHEIFHLFVLGGSASHVWLVLNYI